MSSGTPRSAKDAPDCVLGGKDIGLQSMWPTSELAHEHSSAYWRHRSPLALVPGVGENRDLEADLRSTPRSIAHKDSPAMAFDDLLDDREPKT